MMKLSHAMACLLSLVVVGAGAMEQADLETLITQHVAARGGAAAIEAVRTFECDIRIVEPTFEVDGRYVATRDGRMRVDVSVDGQRVFTEALERGRAWSWSPENGVRAGSESGAAALRHGIELPFKLFGLHEMRVRGHRLMLAGREKIGDIDYHVFGLELNDGFETRYYVNPANGLIERDRQLRALHVDIDPTPEWIETTYEDYRPVAGVQFPHRQVERRLSTGSVLSTVTVRDIRINPPLETGRFSPP